MNELAQTFTIYPLGNAQTMQLELGNGKRMLFDYADMKPNNAETSDKRCSLPNEFYGVTKFDVVMFTHAHEDHIKGASEYFNMEYLYTEDEGVTIGELRLSAAFVAGSNYSCEDARVIRQEARARLKAGKAIKIFGYSEELSKWLEDSNISVDSVQHLMFYAGQNITHELGDEISFFLHAPFSDDCDDVQDKNDPSIVLQMRLHNDDKETNILVTGDVPCDVLDEIVSRTKEKNNEKYLRWDFYDIPHHCSNTGLCNNSDEGVEPTDDVKWLLQQSEVNAYVVASCNALAETDSPPPSQEAADAYKRSINLDVTFRITMEWPNLSAPEPMAFTIDSKGLKPKTSTSALFISKPAPRAG